MITLLIAILEKYWRKTLFKVWGYCL